MADDETTATEMTNTERVKASAHQKGTVRGPLKMGDGLPPIDLPPCPRETVEQVAARIKAGRSVMGIVRDDTRRVKINDRLIHRLVELVGTPSTTLSMGTNYPSVYWPQDRGFTLAGEHPAELYQAEPGDTDIVELILPDDWLK